MLLDIYPNGGAVYSADLSYLFSYSFAWLEMRPGGDCSLYFARLDWGAGFQRFSCRRGCFSRTNWRLYYWLYFFGDGNGRYYWPMWTGGCSFVSGYVSRYDSLL